MRLVSYALLLVLGLSALPAAQAASLSSWDKKFEGARRFKVLAAFGAAAVLDRETNLVWQLSTLGAATWRNSHRACLISNVGGRMGWRMPTAEELLTLVDPVRSPAVPEGAPFQNLIQDELWTANEEAADTTAVVTVNLNAFLLNTRAKTNSNRVLCVRGGHGSDAGVRGGL